MACIISDMIKADNVIEESEIKAMKRLMTDYSLTQRHMYEARRMRFSEAVNIHPFHISGYGGECLFEHHPRNSFPRASA